MSFDPALSQGLTELIELLSQGEPHTARLRAQILLRRFPDQAELWRLSGVCALQLGDFVAARNALDQAIKLAPAAVENWCNLASLFTAQREFGEAERVLRHALMLSPQHAAALNNLGSLLDARGDYFGAAECFAKAISQRPDYARAWINQAASLLSVRQLVRAETSAQRAVQLAPNWADAHFVLGNVLGGARKPGALAAWGEAARLAPANPQYQYQLAIAQEREGRFAAAIRTFEACLALVPDHWPALSQLAFLHRRLCDWRALPPLSRRLLAGIDAGTAGITPFSMLVEDTTPAQQLACARAFATQREMEIEPLQQRLGQRPQSRREGPLRVGFVSSGFGQHPTALLIVELIERLRGMALHTIGYATTADDGSTLRKRLATGFGEFRDLSARALDGMLLKLREDQPDILIDLDGYCEGSRPELFALRPARVQVNWLAYPGTLGAPWCDYLIADPFLVPDEQREHYSEKIALLPRCYQPSDTTRVVGEAPPRAMYGLPADATVFACFNLTWKYTLRSFARWMKILKAAPDSVLWLLAGPPGSGADEHLRRAAHAAGVDPRRLVFALRAPHAEYLARYRLVDLFLDTNPYNAHTTACDALWAGCPVLTQPGQTFASRVAGSLNHHLGMDSMNATSDQQYIDKAVQLARFTPMLATLRSRLDAARRESGVFDMHAYARDFAAALTAMFQRSEQRLPPADFRVHA
ncbi:MAG: tetratricopeptide repeat protein [Proteobacteria bacterium]|nr:tetratricopeptide repeat protein [Pseudomonadota bacterium]